MGTTLHPFLALTLLTFLLVTAYRSIRAFQRRNAASGDVDGSVLLSAGLRAWYFEQLQPIEEACLRRGIQPSALTLAQLALSVIVAAFYASGLLFTGGWLLLAAGSLDIIDGRLARRTTSASVRGAFLDSVVDRYADALAFFGLAVFFRDSWVLWMTLVAFFGTQMVSYTRARGEALGVDCRVGALQRPERYVLLGFGTIFGALLEHGLGTIGGQPYLVVVLVLVGLAISINVTAAQRAVHTWRMLGTRP